MSSKSYPYGKPIGFFLLLARFCVLAPLFLVASFACSWVFTLPITGIVYWVLFGLLNINGDIPADDNEGLIILSALCLLVFCLLIYRLSEISLYQYYNLNSSDKNRRILSLKEDFLGRPAEFLWLRTALHAAPFVGMPISIIKRMVLCDPAVSVRVDAVNVLVQRTRILGCPQVLKIIELTDCPQVLTTACTLMEAHTSVSMEEYLWRLIEKNRWATERPELAIAALPFLKSESYVYTIFSKATDDALREASRRSYEAAFFKGKDLYHILPQAVSLLNADAVIIQKKNGNRMEQESSKQQARNLLKKVTIRAIEAYDRETRYCVLSWLLEYRKTCNQLRREIDVAISGVSKAIETSPTSVDKDVTEFISKYRESNICELGDIAIQDYLKERILFQIECERNPGCVAWD